jgi:hypothetical protein
MNLKTNEQYNDLALSECITGVELLLRTSSFYLQHTSTGSLSGVWCHHTHFGRDCSYFDCADQLTLIYDVMLQLRQTQST